MERRVFNRLLAATFAMPLLPAATFREEDQAKAEYPAIIGEPAHTITSYSDSLVDLAREFGLGFTEIVAANPGIDPWVPGANVWITLPTAHLLPLAPHEGVVLNLADQRLYYFRPDGVTVETAALGIGSSGWLTPTGKTSIVRKKRDPIWFVPKSVREEQPELPAAVRPGPNNPLGKFALYLGWDAYLIHGTNKPYGVGRRASHGCIRLYPEDIAWLYEALPLGTTVRIVDQDVKLARIDEQLWLEVHPTQTQADELEKTGSFTPARPPELEARILMAAGSDRKEIDWRTVRKAATERRGLPVPILFR